MESPTKTQGKPKSGQRNWLLLILGLTVLGCVGVLCFNAIVYTLLAQNRDAVVAALYPSQDIPTTTQASTDAPLEEMPLPEIEEPLAINQIAFIGNDNNLWLVSPDGQNLQAVTDDADESLGYRFPTWAPNGRHIAFLGPRSNQLALYLTATDTPQPTLLYRSPVASPFYLYWSPNSEDLTFLTQEQSGLSMRLVNINDEDKERIIGRGAPFYWSWAPKSDRLLMHVGGAQANSSQAHLSVLDNKTGAKREQLSLAPGQFQAPVWSSDGRYAFYVAEDEERADAIFRMDMRDFSQEKLIQLEGIGRTFIVVSPDNKHLAYLEADVNRPVPLGVPYLIDIDGNNRHQITPRTVMSMYWSPDGSKLALLTAGLNEEEPSIQHPALKRQPGLAAPLPQNLSFRWWSYTLTDENINQLIKINPTTDFMQTVPYFDQYHLSLSFWSPDSRYLVVTSQRAQDNEDSDVIVLDTTFVDGEKRIGAGRMAVWSWR